MGEERGSGWVGRLSLFVGLVQSNETDASQNPKHLYARDILAPFHHKYDTNKMV